MVLLRHFVQPNTGPDDDSLRVPPTSGTGGTAILEVFCSSNGGLDVGKYVRAGVTRYMGVDPGEERVLKCKQIWEARNKPYEAMFACVDIATETGLASERGAGGEIAQYDAVVCWNSLQSVFLHAHRARQALQYISLRLRSGGFFFGYLPDSAEVWAEAQKSVEDIPTIKEELFTARFREDNFTLFEASYVMGLKDGTQRACPLVHFQTMIAMARECGLHVTSMDNFIPFWDTYKGATKDLCAKAGLLDFKAGKPVNLLPDQAKLISMHCIFVFKKI
jgi:mRNA (guanine-N7-)-methyltransferase